MKSFSKGGEETGTALYTSDVLQSSALSVKKGSVFEDLTEWLQLQ